MNSFIYDIPTRVYFGEGQLDNLGNELRQLGKKVLLTYGGGSVKRTGLYDRLAGIIKEADLELFECGGIDSNPKIEDVRRGAELCKQNGIDVILAVGGGSVFDASKAIAAGACVDFDPWDFFKKQVPMEKALPIVTVVTASASGSEMDSCLGIRDHETNEKIELIVSQNSVLPKVTFLDPTLTYTVGERQTKCGSVDILSHTLEQYFDTEEGYYLIESMQEAVMKTIIKFAPVAVSEPDNYEARANLMWAAPWAVNGFLTQGSMKYWSCHSMENPLSAHYDITHGQSLAILLPRWLEYCLSEETVSRYVKFGVNVFGIDSSLEPMDIAKKSLQMLSDFLYNQLGLANTFEKIGVPEDKIHQMAQEVCAYGPVYGFTTLTADDVEAIYRKCL